MQQSANSSMLCIGLGIALIIVGCSGRGIQAQLGGRVQWDFETQVGPEWSTDRTVDLGSNKVLGLFNNRNRKYPGGTNLTIADIPPNTSIQVVFDLYFIGDWDSGGELADRWTLKIAGADALIDLTSFDHGWQNGVRVPTTGTRGQVDTGRRTLAYHVVTNKIVIQPDRIGADGKLTLDFMGYLTGQGTEFCALDNVSVTLDGTP